VNGYLVEAGALDLAASDVVGLVVETGCRFVRPIGFPEPVETGLRVGRLGRTSVRYELGVFTAGSEEAAAFGHFVHVYVDRATRRPVPLPARLRDALLPLIDASPALVDP
jgi:acyl-CoA thioester hydrolase